MKRILSLIFIIFISTNLFSQKINDSLLIFHARIVSSDSSQPLHNAHIISKFNRWGTISNDNGEFKMLVSNGDSLLISSIGYRPKVLRIDSSKVSFDEAYEIIMHKDTVLINEIVIHAFWDYRTFKQLIVNMEPLNLDNFYPDWEGTELLYRDPTPLTFKGPIQALYDVFNQSAKLRRQLIKNRREYNKLMMQMGRPNDTIPAYPEHIIDGN
ncbi:MAG: hypothetical protein C0595_00130 [Marinilabiliales bacterium]|nr:MAG: hypothetical protein C0595_00130 [Marinilabiliales bacterium]